MASNEIAREKAAKLLVKKRGSISSLASSEALIRNRRHGSLSTVSFMDEPGGQAGQESLRLPMKLENTYKMNPEEHFPVGMTQKIIGEVLSSYLAEERYEPELCRQMSKKLSEVIKARIKDLQIPRYKLICLVHIGQINDQGIRLGSRCLWDHSNDNFTSFDFKNSSLYAVGSVYAIYYE